MTHAAESTHYYTRDGEPAYTVTAKAGHERPTNVSDARKLGLLPSVTTILQCAAKPALERWKAEQLMLAALTLPRNDGEVEKEWIARVWNDSKETARKAAERGTAIHAAIQSHLESGGADSQYHQHCLAVRRALADSFGDIPWLVERSFGHPLGFGGKVDVHSPAGVVCDFKTKEFAPDTKMDTYPEHAMQLAAYRHGLGLDGARCAIGYVSVTHPGLVRVLEIPEPDIAKGWKCFYSLLHFWQARTGYTSAFEKLAA